MELVSYLLPVGGGHVCFHQSDSERHTEHMYKYCAPLFISQLNILAVISLLFVPLFISNCAVIFPYLNLVTVTSECKIWQVRKVMGLPAFPSKHLRYLGVAGARKECHLLICMTPVTFAGAPHAVWKKDVLCAWIGLSSTWLITSSP